MRTQTICLNMIVKNESHVIEETLEQLHKIFKFDYWVISDTGSTDNTKELITSFFKEKQVLGELVENEWKGFGPSRTDALIAAYNKTDYLFIFDADDRIEGNLQIPDILVEDGYSFKFGKSFCYYRPLLINNRKKWIYKGIIHNYLDAIDKMDKIVELKGNYYIESRRLGNFNLDPLKYKKQAEILKTEFEKEMESKQDIGLANRYAFYCAQSYKDFGDTDNAIQWYSKVVNELNNWNQEKYYSCLQLGNLFKNKGSFKDSIYYYLKSIEYDTDRIEGIVFAIKYLKEMKMDILAISLYEKYKNYNTKIDVSKKLFVYNSVYLDMEVEFVMSIMCYYVKGQEYIGYECCKKIIKNKNFDSYTYSITLKNMTFPIYINFLLKENKQEILTITDIINEFMINKTKDNVKEYDNILELLRI